MVLKHPKNRFFIKIFCIFINALVFSLTMMVEGISIGLFVFT